MTQRSNCFESHVFVEDFEAHKAQLCKDKMTRMPRLLDKVPRKSRAGAMDSDCCLAASAVFGMSSVPSGCMARLWQ